MNQPPYILVDAFVEVVANVKAALGLDVLRYEYGTINELNETLKQLSEVPEYRSTKYPLIWLRQPFILQVGRTQGYYADVEGLSIFIINPSDTEKKSSQRMAENFKPVIYPIYYELLKQMNNHEAIGYSPLRKLNSVDRYYWGPRQQDEINDVIDCMELNQIELKINDNLNLCQ